MEDYFNVSAEKLTCAYAVEYNKCFEGLGFNHFYVQSPCNHPMEDYAEILYMIDKEDIPSIQYKMNVRASASRRKVGGLNFIFTDVYVPPLTPSINRTETSQ
jgi:hypothetical protein